MITIKIDGDKETRRIEVCGHAGYAEKGKDIVCAGASMLFSALAAYCNYLDTVIYYSTQDPDAARIMYIRNDLTDAATDMFAHGARLLARRYPQYVTLAG